MDNYLYQIYNCFSYWIYIWFILYYFRIINISPIIIFILFIILIIDLIKYGINNSFTNVVLLRIYILIVMHHIPLIYLINDLKKKTKNEVNIIVQKSLLYLIIISLIYIIYLGIHKTNPHSYYLHFVNNIPENVIDYIKLRFNNETVFIIFIVFTLYISYKILYKLF